MGVFKEEAHAIETIAKKQVRIYNDAADYGYPYDSKNPNPEIKRLIQVMSQFQAMDKESKEKYPGEKLFIRNRDNWESGKNQEVSLDLIIFWEKDGDMFCGTKYHLRFNRTPAHPSLMNKDCNAFISVDIERYKER